MVGTALASPGVTAELVLRRGTFGNPCFRRQEAPVRPGVRPIHTEHGSHCGAPRIFHGKIMDYSSSDRHLYRSAHKPMKRLAHSKSLPLSVSVSRDAPMAAVLLPRAGRERVSPAAVAGVRPRVPPVMVPGGGFEPPTRGFSVRCSTN